MWNNKLSMWKYKFNAFVYWNREKTLLAELLQNIKLKNYNVTFQIKLQREDIMAQRGTVGRTWP